MNNLRLSLAALTVLELKPFEQVEVASQAGFQSVGLRLIPATTSEQHCPLVGNPQELKNTKRALSQTGISVLDIEIFRLREDTDVKDFTETLEIGAELGATEVLVAGNDDDEPRLSDNLYALCELASDYALNANLEFMPWTGVKNLQQASRILEIVDRENAGLLIDPFHLNRSHSDMSHIDAIPQEWLRYAQLCDIAGQPPVNMSDIIREARQERLFPGDGDIDLVQLLSLLPHHLPYSVEVPTAALQAKGVSALDRAILAKESCVRLFSKLDDSKSTTMHSS